MYKKINTPTNWGGNGMSKTTDSYVVSKKELKNDTRSNRKIKNFR